MFYSFIQGIFLSIYHTKVLDILSLSWYKEFHKKDTQSQKSWIFHYYNKTNRFIQYILIYLSHKSLGYFMICHDTKSFIKKIPNGSWLFIIIMKKSVSYKVYFNLSITQKSWIFHYYYNTKCFMKWYPITGRYLAIKQKPCIFHYYHDTKRFMKKKNHGLCTDIYINIWNKVFHVYREQRSQYI